MIDEKKVVKVAIAFGDKAEWAEDANARVVMQYSFKEGADWAFQEFKKNLWHDKSEEPMLYDTYLVKTLQGCIDMCFFDAEGWHEPKIGGGNVAMWLNLKDLLPKEGGEE